MRYKTPGQGMPRQLLPSPHPGPLGLHIYGTAPDAPEPDAAPGFTPLDPTTTPIPASPKPVPKFPVPGH